jgi:hypothetical protein
MSKVFVVEAMPQYDLSPALKYGSIEFLMQHREVNPLNTAGMVARMRGVLSLFTDDDYVLPIGDPVAIGVACALAADCNRGKFKILKWDKREKVYFSLLVDIHCDPYRGT